ncbi:hypothetical protein [Aquimarina litoralis]
MKIRRESNNGKLVLLFLMKRYTSVLLSLISFLSFGQQNSWLKGQVIVNALELEAINIVNLTKEIGTISSKSGYFEIPADLGDIVVFSSVQYKLKKFQITEEQLLSDNYKVFLEPEVNTLDEVHISQYSLTGDIKKDLEDIPTYEKNLPFWNAEQLKQMGVARPNDAQSPVENTVLKSGNEGAGVSIDLMGFVQAVSGIFQKKSKEDTPEIRLHQYYKEEFFIKELKIPETEFYNFMDFLDQETEIQTILSTRDGLKILEYLMFQSKVFRDKYNIQK